MKLELSEFEEVSGILWVTDVIVSVIVFVSLETTVPVGEETKERVNVTVSEASQVCVSLGITDKL